MTMSAAETVVGEDNYAPNGASFTWNFEIDLSTQKFTAVVDLSTCNADNTNENVFSVGTDINAYFSNKQMAGNIHFYYTPSTKTLSCQYISSNKTYGAYKYIISLENIEGEVSIALSKQFGLEVNGRSVFNAAQLTKLLTWSNMQCGSAEGTTRSNATVVKARVKDTSFVKTFTAVGGTAKVLYDGAYTRFDEKEAIVNYTAESFTNASLVIPQLTIGGKVLGDITISGLTYENMESSGNNSLGYVALLFSDAKATISNLGALGTELGLTEGQDLTMGEVADYDVYFYGQYLYMELSFTVGEKEIVYTYNPDDPIVKTFTSTLTTSMNNLEGNYANQTMQVTDYGDGFADLTINGLQFEAMSSMSFGALTVKEVPYTVNGLGEKEFNVTDLTVDIECTGFDYVDMTDATITGKVSGDEAYFKVSGQYFGFPTTVTFGEPIAEYTQYTGYQTVYGGDGSTSEINDGKLAVRDEGDGTYTFILTDVYGQSSLMFTAQGTVHSNGDVTYTADYVKAPLHDEGWEGYYAYITTSDAKSNGDKFYGVFDVDFAGYAKAGYSYYACTVVFGEEFTGINNVANDFDNQPVQIYNLNGVRMNALQRGVNIVRNANGKTMKVVKK